MLQPIYDKHRSSFEEIYDQYSSSLYGVILKMSVNETEAERILTESFKLFFSQRSTVVNEKFIFSDLLRITINITAEYLNIPKRDIGKLIFKDLPPNAFQLI